MAGLSKSGVRGAGQLAEGSGGTGGKGGVRQGGTIAQGSGRDSENRTQYHDSHYSGRGPKGKPSKSGSVRG